MKCKNEIIRYKLKQITKDKKEFDIFKLLEKIEKMYKLVNLKINNIVYGYDMYEIFIGNHEEESIYKIVLDDLFTELIIQDNSNSCYDTYKIDYQRLIFKERIFKNQYGKIIYNPRDVIKSPSNTSFKIKFQSKYLNTVIEITYPNNSISLEELIIDEILKNKVKNILDLYSVINHNLVNLKTNIKIQSYQNGVISEYLEIKEQELVNCRIKTVENDEERLINYQNGKLTITTISNPETNQDFIKIKKRLNKEQVWKKN